MTEATDFQRAYDDLLGQGLALDLTRGKPAPEQLDLAEEMLSLPGAGDHLSAAGVDVRNYGGDQGLPELREIFAELLNVPVAQLLALDNSSLSLMHDVLVYSLLHGRNGAEPWAGRSVKFLCPVPGYDRHFALCESMGIEMVPVALGERGPDVEQIAALVAEDPSIVGIWTVPTYANPTGAVYDEETVRALVSMPTAAPDFTIMWDNAYALHHLTDEEPAPIDVHGLAAAAGNPDRVISFASTSKITFAGAGVAFLGGSVETIAWFRNYAGFRSIGPNKVNQLRHVRFFGDAEGVRAHMRRHREIIAPKFDLALRILQERLGDAEAVRWSHPAGGYFITLEVADGTATRVVQLAKEAGIALTPAGASHPYRNDPDDRVIRLAPTMPSLAQLEAAIEGVAICVRLAAAEVPSQA
ncbi:aminotransferase class I/II-fold pyridoxal phosphate-dependent enzyme [Parenemella sanctibonifatiensis]|uniref:Aminotransferase n=1 Tax=Parenemella sanctibonifatiensis TaxID=2016505 RepID=A0A255EBT5_9ACTN|nr:aminotransferase class I/II-fold pyridoxal phosphate-dependent enzyme [Parenemella sanctibonifatiensis]OYN87535.1 aminotransferase [Parenemella sanctibonifatiensis]OYN89019.1 aminotransferase [Parenemella sanctibonifatiensis]